MGYRVETLVNRQLEARGLCLGKGTIIDASVIESGSKKPPGFVNRSSSGVDKKERHDLYGYKAHVAVDDQPG